MHNPMGMPFFAAGEAMRHKPVWPSDSTTMSICFPLYNQRSSPDNKFLVMELPLEYRSLPLTMDCGDPLKRQWLEINGRPLVFVTGWMRIACLTFEPSAVGSHVRIPLTPEIRDVVKTAEMFAHEAAVLPRTCEGRRLSDFQHSLIFLTMEAPYISPRELPNGWYRLAIDISLVSSTEEDPVIRLHPRLVELIEAPSST